MSESLLPRREVERRTGYRKSAIYAKVAAGTFPAPRRDPETGTVRWLESEVQTWIDAAVRDWPLAGQAAGTDSPARKKAA